MSRKAKERIVYDNYDLWDSYSEDAKETYSILLGMWSEVKDY